LPVAKENWLVGVGVGDKIDVYMEQYRKDNNLVSLEREYNSHNQYIDTLVVTGIAGLALLLSFFVVPAVLAFKNRRFDVVFALFLFMIFFNALFESVFERQAGIMFFVLFFTLMFNAEFVVGEEKESKVLG
jgi:O-antigen ligase